MFACLHLWHDRSKSTVVGMACIHNVLLLVPGVRPKSLDEQSKQHTTGQYRQRLGPTATRAIKLTGPTRLNQVFPAFCGWTDP